MDENNLAIDELFQNVYEFGWESGAEIWDFYISCILEGDPNRGKKFRIGQKSFCIEGFSEGENAGMIRVRIGK